MKGEVLGDVGLHMAETDNVVTAIDDLETGTEIPWGGTAIELQEDVEFGHKVALEPIQPGDVVRKYGEPIGEAVETIAPGEWVHTHNCESARGRGDRADAEVI
ncbi:UxaA family hydrolase [Halalkalicoccus jeotgali]|uniref:Dehydratase n=1 Tax=Halalkalicoccus jeotgali (strain DSM 18796 / CECT 7217 / JCM 14584 / KCTC 4019 / B3) TaxID=795797 RepID=D8J6I6_HALJB|nr:UxaA family hydrolase [Halalkalicoccus jeotgali]ADJ13863.1 dehydratase [Halalkalicoccus jeotgali B3]ELY34091.1 dehydratase [Halalkalicoccus jeotgali B3]